MQAGYEAIRPVATPPGVALIRIMGATATPFFHVIAPKVTGSNTRSLRVTFKLSPLTTKKTVSTLMNKVSCGGDAGDSRDHAKKVPVG